MKVKSDQAGLSFLDLILLIKSSVDRLTLDYCTKTPPDTPNIPIESLYMNSNLSALLTYKLTLEAALAAEISFLIWNRIKLRQRQSNIRRSFSEAIKNVDWARATQVLDTDPVSLES